MIYFVRLGPDGPIKIGTTTHFSRRLKELAKEYGVEVRALGVRDGGPAEEREHHQRFDHLRLKVRDRWKCEQFHPMPDLMSYIERECRRPNLLDVISECEPTLQVGLKVPTRIHKLLRVVAASRDVSMATYVRNLIIQHVEADLKAEFKRRGVKL